MDVVNPQELLGACVVRSPNDIISSCLPWVVEVGNITVMPASYSAHMRLDCHLTTSDYILSKPSGIEVGGWVVCTYIYTVGIYIYIHTRTDIK